jgi:soluble lytic murein transglycosylase-like protein
MRPDRGLAALSLAAGLGLAALSLVPSSAAAQPPTAFSGAALSGHDLSLYQAAFDAATRGDTASADAALAQVSDLCLAGKVQYLEFTHGKLRTASYEELSAWLKLYGDLPGAPQVYQMALRLKPADVLAPPPVTASGDSDMGVRSYPAPESRGAREAFFSGQIDRAYDIARESGDAWIAGLSAYRLGRYADAMESFESLAANSANPGWLRAAGGVWGARSAGAAGMADRAAPLLKIAATAPETFYGMIAVRKLQLADDPLGRLVDAAVAGAPTPSGFIQVNNTPAGRETALDQLVRTDARARRAVALMQLARPGDAGAEVSAGLAAAQDDATRELWMGLMFELNPQRPAGPEVVLHNAMPVEGASTVYPTPTLQPTGGFTIDRALVYAITWQESRFNGLAVSPVGAVGLMQLMPRSAAFVSGDATLGYNPIPLYDTGKNLALGQNYVTWLEQNASDYDILRTIAAYNAGPHALSRTEGLVGPDGDSLMVIESMPAAETRDYVKKVMAAYWSYRRQFGGSTRTLDAVASDMRTIDVRLDASTPVQNPQPTSSTEARQALEILLSHTAG